MYVPKLKVVTLTNWSRKDF